MEETKTTPVQRVVAAFKAITLAQAITVVAIIAGTVWAFMSLPDERLQMLIATVGALGGVGTLALSPRRAEPPAAPPPPPVRVRVGRKDGSVSDWVLWALAGAAFAFAWLQRLGVLGVLVLAVAASAGCSMGTLAAHSTAAHATTVALDEAWRVVDEQREPAFARCVVGDVACVEGTRRDLHTVNALLLGIEAGIAGWVAYIELAHLSGMSEGLESAIRSAAARVLGMWDPLVASLAVLGVTLPPLPPMVLAWVGGES